jgi:hypothetical protein
MEAKTVFFSFYEKEIIRRVITEELAGFYNTKIKNLMFATSAKVFAYINQIVSVRIIIAKFYKINLEDIRDKEEREEYIKLEQADPTKLIEQEVDSDEDDDLIKNDGKTIGQGNGNTLNPNANITSNTTNINGPTTIGVNTHNKEIHDVVVENRDKTKTKTKK